MLFAAPISRANEYVTYVLLMVWALFFILVVVGIVRGIRLIRSESLRSKSKGLLLLYLSGLLPFLPCFVCCPLAPYFVRLTTGSYPLGRYPSGEIQEGMSTDKVRAILGSPHQLSQTDDKQSWLYWIDSVGISYFAVSFGPDGRVTSTYGD